MITFLILMILTIIFTWSVDIKHSITNYIITFIVIMITSYLIIPIILKPSINLTQKKYGVKYQTERWDIFLCAVVKAFLTEKKVYTQNMKNDEVEETFNFLITRLKEKVERRKKISFSNVFLTSSTLVLTIFIPVWSAFNTWFFKEKNNLEILCYYVVGSFLIPLLVVLWWRLIVWRNLPKEFVNFETSRILSLIEKLEIIKLSLKNPYYHTEIDNYLKNKKKVIKCIIQDVDEEYYLINHSDPIERIFRRLKYKNNRKRKEKSNKNAF
ncbi:hypothetical protein [Priestia megaterium]|uniref:hypothetical protein n=1 Tax=Priestia megaterium TaxID=1404 RepID=UPI002570D80C|nr:hypothetical protein [Priestia megaterium]WJD83537.1 hypothetical protein QRD24_26930 [Priestia megaterium]